MQNLFLHASNCSKRLSSATNRAFSVQHACGLSTTPLFSMLMRLRMLKLSVGKGRQVMKQLCLRVLQYSATVATERAGYVLYRALVVPRNVEVLKNIPVILTHNNKHVFWN